MPDEMSQSQRSNSSNIDSRSLVRRGSVASEVDMCTSKRDKTMSRFVEMMNFINNEMTSSKRLAKAGREGLIERVQEWGLEQANLEGRIQALKEENERLRHELKQAEQKQVSMPMSYATVASKPINKLSEKEKIIEKSRRQPEHTLFITSEKFTNGKKVQDEVTKILDPRTQILKINKMRTTAKALIIEASSKEDLEKIMSNPKMKDFKCELPKKKRPLMIIYDVTTNKPDDEIVEDIRTQNFEDISEEEFKNEFKVRFKTGPKGKSTCNLVVEVSPQLRKKMSGKKLYIGFTSVNTKDYIVVPKCLKCQDLGHIGKYCAKTENICSHCGESGHIKKDCQKKQDPSVCIPCKNRGKTCKNGSDCQTHRMLLDRMIQKTDYGQ
ncbi:unnamed protein product [Phaedon cochleariae]|uniref:CCHC-type domain-containing protein n=1 Tax=Phaedon cochleariae TaxID=80249 RepID=A0A9P0E0R1_PHACE|nr:unnamed protein product [Phaedon cochleariae]